MPPSGDCVTKLVVPPPAKSNAQPTGTEDSIVNPPKSSTDAMAIAPPTRKRERMLRELKSLEEDNSEESERERMVIWRKLQKTIARNDDISNE